MRQGREGHHQECVIQLVTLRPSRDLRDTVGAAPLLSHPRGRGLRDQLPMCHWWRAAPWSIESPALLACPHLVDLKSQRCLSSLLRAEGMRLSGLRGTLGLP